MASGRIFVNDEIEKRTQEDNERLRQLDLQRFLAFAAAKEKKQPFSMKRTVNEDVKYLSLIHI